MTSASVSPDWIAVDWGTSNMRAFAMKDSAVIAEAQSDKGMGALEKSEFESALLETVQDWLGDGPMPIVACGMVGARQGWVEAPYGKVPCPPLSANPARPDVRDTRLSVVIIPGLSQDSPADVMRGEETQIAGHLALRPNFDGVLCLPGTHTKWVQISAGEVVSFRTFMSGELFALLSKQSVLRHSIGDGWNNDAFAEAVSDAMARPEAIAARLFSLRAETLLHGLDPGAARARASGLLIGSELAAARPYWLGQEIVLIGADALSKLYATALTAQGAAPKIADGTATTLAGLTAAYDMLKGDTP